MAGNEASAGSGTERLLRLTSVLCSRARVRRRCCGRSGDCRTTTWHASPCTGLDVVESLDRWRLTSRRALWDHLFPATSACPAPARPMRRLPFLAAAILGLVLAGAAFAATAPPHLNLRELSSAQCTPVGSGAEIVVDVTFILDDYADSGYADEWAIDTVHRHLRIWRHFDGTYCAQIADDGSTFVTRAGPSPTGDGFVQSGVTGTFFGGVHHVGHRRQVRSSLPQDRQPRLVRRKVRPDIHVHRPLPDVAQLLQEPKSQCVLEVGLDLRRRQARRVGGLRQRVVASRRQHQQLNGRPWFRNSARGERFVHVAIRAETASGQSGRKGASIGGRRPFLFIDDSESGCAVRGLA